MATLDTGDCVAIIPSVPKRNAAPFIPKEDTNIKIRYPITNSQSVRNALRDVRLRHRTGLDWRVQQVHGETIYLIFGGEEHRMDFTPELQKLLEERH